MSDYLRQRIKETRIVLEAKLQDVASLKGQLQAYEDALAHEAPPPAPNGAGHPQPAVLSRMTTLGARAAPSPPPPPNAYWGKLLIDLSRQGDRFTLDDVVTALARLDKSMERKSVRAKLTALVKEGVVIRIEDGVFKLAPHAAGSETDLYALARSLAWREEDKTSSKS